MQDLKFTLMILSPPPPYWQLIGSQFLQSTISIVCDPTPTPLDDPVIMTTLSISFEIKNSIEDEKQMLYEQEWNPLQRRKSCRNPPIPPPPPTGITRDRPIMISVITVIIYNSNKFDEDDDNNYEGKFS